MGKCKICGSPGFTYVPEYKGYLCKEHYSRFIQAKVDRCVKRHGLLRGVKRLLVGVSGGKDSVSLLHILSHLYRGRIEIKALFINLGIPVYSAESMQAAAKAATLAGVDIDVVDIKEEYGFTIRDAAELFLERKISRPPCSVCGTVKRYILNKYAVEKGFDAVATGHNLDDFTRFSAVNIVTGMVKDLVKQVPREDSIHPKMATRIKPLCLVSNEETRKYVLANDLPVVESSCPYKPPPRKLSSLIAGKIDEIEGEIPGFKAMFIGNLWSKILPMLNTPREQLRECELCGMPSSGKVCSFCRLRETITEAMSKERFL
ncbi:MAG: adenine nucleotide alpha hydrolase family protein [Desulfurococcales archaeon]|nr:adenine nucleotide alpha hydrolase family protein [Desulfurococcales archaeon]